MRLSLDSMFSSGVYKVDQAKKLRELEKENIRLKKLVANLEDTRGELAQKQTEIDRLRAENAIQDERFASLEQQLLAMEASMN